MNGPAGASGVSRHDAQLDALPIDANSDHSGSHGARSNPAVPTE